MRRAVVAMVAGLAMNVAVVAAQSSAPASAPVATTRPAMTVTVPGLRPTGTPTLPKSMADRIIVNDIERTVLEATRDASRQLDDTGLYATLSVAGRARNNVQLDPEEWELLDRPAYQNLLAQPERWRTQPLQLAVNAFRVTELKAGEGLNYSRFWPKDRTVWRIDALALDGPAPEKRPVVILSVANPSEYLDRGKPGKEAHQTEYEHGPTIKIAAVFYKVLTATDKNGHTRLYPVVMAWQLDQTEPDVYTPLGTTGGAWGNAALPAMLLIVVLAAFYLVRRQVTRAKQRQAQGPQYRPLRNEADDATKAEEDADPSDKYVDPDLAKAVEQYRHEKGIDSE